MNIEFGYFLDAVPWSDGPALGYLRVGPAAFLDLLATRLARGREPVPATTRTAAYLRALRETLTAAPRHSHWYARSFASDPWATAERLLALRDSAVRAGWDCRIDGSGEPDSAPVRLAALAAVEKSFDSAAYPGSADALASVERELRRKVGGNLGIERIEVREDPAELPDLWPAIFRHLRARGVTVDRLAVPQGVGSLRIVSCADEGDAAIQAARAIEALSSAGAPQPFTVVASRPTQLLDEALADRGRPALGVVEAVIGQPRFDLLGLLIHLTESAPIDVYLLDQLLWSTLVSGQPLFSKRVRHRLHRALAAEPSVFEIESDGSLTAWGLAHEELTNEGGASAAGARHVRELLDIAGGSRSPGERARAVAAWLSDRMSEVRRTVRGNRELPAANREAVEAQCAVLDRQIGEFLDSMELLDDPQPGMLHRLASAFAGDPLLPARQVGALEVVGDPGALSGYGPVLWWGAVDPGTDARDLWERDEAAYLEGCGVRIIPASVRAQMETAHRLAALSPHSIIAFVPRKVGGEQVGAHPLLAYLVKGRGSTVSRMLDELTVDSADLGGEQWRLGEGALSLVEVPVVHPVRRAELSDPTLGSAGLHHLDREDGLRRAKEAGVCLPPMDEGSWLRQLPAGLAAPARITPHGSALLPTRLSYSQLDKLLGCTLCWVLEYPMRLRPVGLDDVPAGNRMIGTAVHAVIERIISSGNIPVTEGEVEAAIERHFHPCIRRFASPLLRPGHALVLEDVRERTRRSLTAFFVQLARSGITITGAEEKFTEPLTLPSSGAEHWEVSYTGFRDVDARLGERPVVIDIKWSNSRTWFGKLIAQGLAIQLAGYSWSVEGGGEPPLTGYFLAKHGIFASSDPELPGSTLRAGRSARTLWKAVRTSLGERLDLLASGVVPAAPGQIRRLIEDEGMDPKLVGEPADSDFLNLSTDSPCGYSATRYLCGAEGTI